MSFYLDFSKVLDTVYHSILLEKLAAYGLDRCTVCWMKNWLDGQAQGHSECSSVQLVASHQGSVLAPVLVNVFINNLYEEIEYTLSKITDNAWSSGRVHLQEGFVE